MRAGPARLRRPGLRRWAFPVCVATAAAACIMVLVFVGRDDDGAVRATAGPGRLYLAPSGLDGRFRLTNAETDPRYGPASPVAPGAFRAFGRRAPDGLALEASVVVVVPSDFALIGAEPASPLPALGQKVAVSTDHYGLRILSWTQRDGQTVGVMTFGVPDDALVRLAESLLAGDASRDTPALPPGFTPVHRGDLPGGPPPVSIQSWEADDGDNFMVTVSDVPGATVDDVAWYLPGGRATPVRGAVGVYSERQDADLAWIERPGTVVTVHGAGLSEAELVAIAEGLRPVDENAWWELAAGARRLDDPAPGRATRPGLSPKALNAANSYFVIRPVEGRSAPPCRPERSEAAAVAPETPGGQGSCLQLGPPMLAADDVSTATARQGRTSGEWEVEFTLSREGTARFADLFQAVGAGGEIAILVDGRVVSAPRVASATAAPKGVVTGLDEQSARSLAARLRP